MTTGPEHDSSRPDRPDPIRKSPSGEHNDDEQPEPEADHDQSNELDTRVASSGMRPYGGDPDPEREKGTLPGKWHDHQINKQKDR
ncbi:hypothetical protein SAMN05216266_14910 [Amycolatopsis marina]|uniref:Uncharacterized protein n=1 Tax=Amycolatopsis marina TaxID=490629 RepID=A0A1I1CQC7_9PSEU|nr:hypothetical protein FHX69_7178 [Prauserella muralis]SFB64851.1 hypothetical protein SAMN05216266_14910 [Amycolatopsis marina]